MLDIKNLSIFIKNDKEIIKNLNITVNMGDKLAIIGEEGNGKSTLLKCIYEKGLIEDYSIIEGNILKNNNKIGYLEQFMNPLWEEQFVEEYYIKQKANSEINYDIYSRFYELEQIFKQLNLNEVILNEQRKIKTLSGGEKVKLQLSKILLNSPDILLLDEPTNDIDIQTLEWLEEYINNSKIPIIYVSHDETLLENTANCILHLEQINNKQEAKYTYEHIGYKEYIEKRLNLLDKQDQLARNEKREHDKQVEKFNQIFNKVHHEQETITRQDPVGGRLLKKKMKSVKALEKRLNGKELTKRPNVEEAILVKFHNEDNLHNKKIILNLKLDELKVGNKVLKKDILLKIIGKEKVTIIGENGSGKTTLLKIIHEELKSREDIKAGYMPQNYDELLNLKENVIDSLKSDYSRDEETIIRTYLASLKFTQEEMLGKIESLSGGQKAKLFIVKLIIDKCNVLILDEPTRNLSPLSNPVIRKVLKEFNGSIISVSHDRKYIDEVSDRIIDFNKI